MATVLPLFLVLLLVVQLAVLAVADDAEDDDITRVSVVTHGSVVKLVHVPSGHRLHSHEIPYGSGSGQQSVTGFHSAGDGNSYWVVKPPHTEPVQPAGVAVRCGDAIRLQHVRTATNLHSHEHRAPLSSDQEVSAYRIGSGEGYVDGDESDDWTVDCTKRGAKEWGRGEEVRFVHVVSGRYLAAAKNYEFSNPIPNQIQVSANKRKNANTVWKTDEGFYFVPTDANKKK